MKGQRHQGGKNGEARTMVLDNKHIPTGSNSLKRACNIVKNDYLICSF
jgi:hypothetical protein